MPYGSVRYSISFYLYSSNCSRLLNFESIINFKMCSGVFKFQISFRWTCCVSLAQHVILIFEMIMSRAVATQLNSAYTEEEFKFYRTGAYPRSLLLLLLSLSAYIILFFELVIPSALLECSSHFWLLCLLLNLTLDRKTHLTILLHICGFSTAKTGFP